jgi:hypothetical protein
MVRQAVSTSLEHLLRVSDTRRVVDTDESTTRLLIAEVNKVNESQILTITSHL